MSKTLHIIAFDMPYPADYGGVIDIYYKIRALSEQGVKIKLHVFLYGGKTASPHLESLCQQVFYYERKRFKNPFTGELPYIVATRTDETLLFNLCKDDAPILFEGLHSTALLSAPELSGRFKMVRTHNVEHDYYQFLEEAETSFFKKYFFRIESERLRRYESVLGYANLIMPISPKDTTYYKTKFSRVQYLPAFHTSDRVESQTGRGEFVLYHGNLGVGENNKAALFLVHEVFPFLDMPCFIAGNQPTRQLKTAAGGMSNVTLLSDISSEEILQKIIQAQVNLLVTFQSTGIKLKLLNALHKGRFCVANRPMVAETGLESLCMVADDTEQLIKSTQSAWLSSFEEEALLHRQSLLDGGFSNRNNAVLIASYL
ncbi:MAG: hypothetical protein RIT07_999 [Bacteroidota bacterium]